MQDVKGEPSIPEIDNLYLDMNGIIHPCTHGNSESVVEQAEDEMFDKICAFLDQLVQLTKPKKLLYLAIDGVAPRAKMNQQVQKHISQHACPDPQEPVST